MSALARIVRAALVGLLAWLVIQSAIFCLVHAAPGGPAAALAGDFATRETQAVVARTFALDQSIPVQYAAFLRAMVLGDWGMSYYFRRPVSELISERLLPTAILMLSALAISVFAGRRLGLWAAWAPSGGAWVVAAMAVHALPVFWVGQLMLLSLGLELRWFPISGITDARAEASGWAAVTDVLWHAAMPVAALSLQQTAYFTTIVFAKAREEIPKGYVRAAAARAIDPRAILWGHVGRNTSPQIATAVFNRVGMLFSGAVLIETLFSWPGLGRLISTAILNRDHPVLLGVFGLVTGAVIVSSVFANLVQAYLDPRLTREGDPR